MISVAIVDTGPLVAVANRADPDHEACLAALRSPGFHLVIPVLCIAEAAYLIGRRQGPAIEARFLRGLESFEIHAPSGKDWNRAAEIVAQYSDFPVGAADATVVVAAESLATDLLITLDRRHFPAMKPKHRDAFRILPE